MGVTPDSVGMRGIPIPRRRRKRKICESPLAPPPPPVLLLLLCEWRIQGVERRREPLAIQFHTVPRLNSVTMFSFPMDVFHP